MVMGNVSGRKEEDQEYHIGYAHGHGQGQVQTSNYHVHMLNSSAQENSPRAYQFPLMFTPEIQHAEFYGPSAMPPPAVPEKEIPAVISWIHDGRQVAIEGSWDNWKTREILEGSNGDFSIMKMLKAGIYHYRFIVDGRWTYDPELPHECDNMGNVFNILDMREHTPEDLNPAAESESPPSPTSSYNNAPFTLEDLHEKMPELPPLLQKTPLDQTSSSNDYPEAVQKPLPANLNHLYIQRGGGGQPTVALSSTQRFRSKYVTTVLYKPSGKLRK